MILFSSILWFLLSDIGRSQTCTNNCNGRGTCDVYGRCTCEFPYAGADCSERLCPLGLAWHDIATAVDSAHAPSPCSNRGLCDRVQGVCDCQSGFYGAACDRLDCDLGCNGYGKCLSMNNLAKYSTNSQSLTFAYDSVWDSNKVSGCLCDVGYFSYNCGQRKCPVGDDPLTKNQVNTIQNFLCIANQGTFVLFFRGFPSRTIPFNAKASDVEQALYGIPLITSVKVTFSQPTSTVCSTRANVVSVEFLLQFGALPPLVSLMDATMAVNGQITVSANGGTLVDVQNKVVTSVVGTKESDFCANRGICSFVDGTCQCFATNGDAYGSSNGYGAPGTLGDCGYITTGLTVSTCPGSLPCSGHGVCTTGTFRCACAAGWTGGDCSLRTCPMGNSWFSYPTADNTGHNTLKECSDMGICDVTTGNCACRVGFYGAACDYMACSNGIGTPCNGHGKCVSMQEAAHSASFNGELLNTVTYGEDPNNPLTWDGYRIYGCVCDQGFSGFDCSEFVCPVGDDPATYDDHNEVQLLKCVANGGTFTLTFRDQTTPPLPYNITSFGLSNALSALPTIGRATVTFSSDGPPPPNTLSTTSIPHLPHVFQNGSAPALPPITWNLNGTSFCDTAGLQVAIISFDVVPGNLPDIKFNKALLSDSVHSTGLAGTGSLNQYSDGASVNSITSVRGTTEVLTCNGRGLCNRQSGMCECFSGWASSDGAGGPGQRGDCGFRINQALTK